MALYITVPSALISTPDPLLCLTITLSAPGVSSVSIICPDAVSFTCEFGYVATASGLSSRSRSLPPPPVYTFVLFVPLALSLTPEPSTYSCFGKEPVGSALPSTGLDNEFNSFGSSTTSISSNILLMEIPF